jgi:hypothetical protein
MRASSYLVLSALSVAVAACSASGGNQFTSSNGTGGTGGATATGTGGDIGLGGGFVGNGGSSGDGCSEAAKLVYVLSTDNAIWSFEPAQKNFNFLFSLDCPTPNDGNSWAPNSMAIDRNAIAWVNYVGSDPLFGDDVAGRIYRVDIDKKTCEPTPAVNLPDSWFRLGMGFSTDAAGGTSETLYVTGTGNIGAGDSPGLGRIDMAQKTVVPVGQFTGSTLKGQSAELTGTGDAKLFGFFTTQPVHVAQIDKGTGATPASGDHALSQVQVPGAWAFSFWGGAFYLYTSDGTSTSTVTKYDPTTNAVDTSYIPGQDTQFIIVGAGVSTCAPLTPPK